MEKRKVAFWEIHKGALARDVQEDFEKAQIIARDRGVEVKVKVEITVYPPNPKEPEYGGVSFMHQLCEPPRKQPKRDTVLQNGVIIADATEPLEQLSFLGLGVEQD